jgi:TPR repeat protein
MISSPSSAAAPSPEGPSPIIGIAMARGDEALAAGDVISARQFYELAATNGFAPAAAAVGQTYDPNFLQGKGVRGALADAQTAERWYEKAIDGGDAEARMRLDKLLKADQGKLAR